MEPIDDWMEHELQRNDMHPKPVVVKVGAASVSFQPPAYPKPREGGLGVPPDYQPPLKATQPWQHPEDAYEVPEHMATGELYSPPTPEPRPTSEERKLIAKIGNVMESAAQLPKDMVTLPEHYARFSIEPIRFVVENKLNFFQANIVKYIMRYDAKNGMEDLKKAQRYLSMFIKWVEGDPDWWRA